MNKQSEPIRVGGIHLRMFEYQAKEILVKEGLDVPRSILLVEETDINKVKEAIGYPVVMKVQTLIGGRGKAGGIQIVNTEEEAQSWYTDKIGAHIKGKKVESILAEELVQIEDEYYLSITLDTLTKEVILLFSTKGGVNVEQTKGATNLFKYFINTNYGLDDFKLNEIFSRANVSYERWAQIKKVINKLYYIFTKYDCMLLEINPLVFTDTNEAIILDAHFYIDDNALYRQAEAKQIVQDMSSVYPQSWLKINYGFDFVKLNSQGTVGLLSTGAGLTMAIVDELKNRNIHTVNFADVRSGQLKGDPTRLVIILKQLREYERLNCIFVSIFAGITDLAEFATLLLEAKKLVVFDREIEWIIRLEGNNFDEAKKVLENEGLLVTNSLETAFDKIVSMEGVRKN